MPEAAQHTPRLAGIAFGFPAFTHYDAIEELSGLLGTSLQAADSMRISAAAIARESLASTHIGMQIAIPHARLSNMDKFLVAVGIPADPIPWGPDQDSVKLVVLSVVPSSANIVYLSFIRSLMQALKNKDQAETLLSYTDETSVRNWLASHLNLT